LFNGLVDTSTRADLANALRERAFETQLIGLMDSMNIPVPANNDVTDRLYSMTVLQLAAFDNYYDNNQTFCNFIEFLQTLVQENGGPFSGVVTPDNTPERSGGGGGDAVGGGMVGG
jgi:hypothetical protein